MYVFSGPPHESFLLSNEACRTCISLGPSKSRRNIARWTISTAAFLRRFQTMDPVLFDLVAKHHVHGPNCATNPRAMCKTPRGFCRWNFPKPYRRSTRVNEDGRVEYARPDNGRTFNFGSVDRPVLVTNRDISSYCPRLLKRFECHVNVDLCFGSNAIKYLYSYWYVFFTSRLTDFLPRLMSFSATKGTIVQRWR